MVERIVIILGKRVPVSVKQRSKAVWIASGSYAGQAAEAKAQTETEALAAWRKVASRLGK